jgi:raffinose/stachyose/melibiose transport system permease protein
MKRFSGGALRIRIISYAVLILLALFILIPEYYLVISTFKNRAETIVSPLALPRVWRFQNYAKAFQQMHYLRAFTNNVMITTGAVTGIILCASMGGYVLNRKAHTRPCKIIFSLILAGLIFPFSMSMLGLYKVVQNLHLINTLWSVIFVHIAGGIPFAAFLFKNFTSTVPFELEESAKIDGAGVFHTFWRIIFPLLKPIIATIAILDTLSIWNDFMIPLYFIQSSRFRVLLQEVQQNIHQFTIDYTMFFCSMVLAILPLLIFFLIMQRYIIGGIMSGSLKA